MDQVIHQVRQDNLAGTNIIIVVVKRIMAQNGLNMVSLRPNYTSPLTEYVWQTELPRGWKVPKFTKFAGDATNSAVEHITQYMGESGDITNNENLRLRFFPSSLTKNVFTWFTMLPSSSINDWTQLERLFHEQFYTGNSKISLKKLASVKQKFAESIDDYLNTFHLLKAMCFTQVPKHELVEIEDGGLYYSIRKKTRYSIFEGYGPVS